MQIIIRLVIIFSLEFLAISSSYSQDEKIMIDFLTKKFTDYIEAVPREEIYIQTDREDFTAGENIWLKIYLIDRRRMKPSERSKIAYVELLNYENRPVVQKKFLLNEGYGPGQLQLPDTLSTGNYLLRAYTNWMKNFLPYNCFMSEIRIFNVSKNKARLRTHDFDQFNKQLNNSTWKIPDSNLKLNFKTRKLENNDLELTFAADNTFNQMYGTHQYIVIQTHGNIDYTGSLKLSGNDQVIVVPAGKLSPGINQITVFDYKGNPVAEKYSYTPPADQGIYEISLAGDFMTRKKVFVSIARGKKPVSDPLSANLSISVIPSFLNKKLKGIGNYLVSGTEFYSNSSLLNGNIKNQSILLTDSLLQNFKSNWIDWNIILSGKVPDILHRTESEEHFLSGRIEDDNQTFTVHSETLLLCEPGKEPDFQTSVTDSMGNFTFSLHIDEDFKDLVILPDDAGKKKNIILEMPFSDKYLPVRETAGTPEEINAPIFEYLSVNHQLRRNYEIPEKGGSLKPVLLPLRPVRFYGKPDLELILADYVALPKMEEIFFELLPGVSLKKRDNTYKILISYRINENTYELTPYLFLDGVKIKDASIIAGLDPAEVEKIDVVKEKYIIGSYIFPGIVNVITKKADFSSISLPDYMIRFPYRIIDPAESFFMPDYSSTDQMKSPVPDFRNTLYWNPSIVPDNDGNIHLEFWTSDLPGKYDLILQGITSDGQMIHEVKTFEVK